MRTDDHATLARARRYGLTALVLAVAGVTAGQIVTARGGPPDPTDARLSHGAVIVDSAVLVFREGLECILVLAAVTASFLGADRAHRRPVAAGARGGGVASGGTGVIAGGAPGAVRGPSPRAQRAARPPGA